MPWGPAVYEKLDAPIRSRASRWVGRQLCKRRAALLLGRRFQAIDVTIGGEKRWNPPGRTVCPRLQRRRRLQMRRRLQRLQRLRQRLRRRRLWRLRLRRLRLLFVVGSLPHLLDPSTFRLR
jgi:hypothetical protein